MVRTLTGSATTKKNLVTGAKPRLLLKIEFGGGIGDKYYCDEALTSPVTASGRIVNAGEIDLRLSARGLQAVGDISVTLADGDGTLRGYLDSTVWALKRVTVYQHFVGNDAGDLVTLLSGYIADSPRWRDSDGTVTFDVTDITTGYELTVGHTASRDDFVSIAENQEGQVLPLVFGRVKDVKCAQVVGGLKGSLLADLFPAAATVIIEGGEKFPQGSAITVRVNAEYITGTLAGKVLTISGRNVSIYAGTTTANSSNNAHAVYDASTPNRDNLFSGMYLDIGAGYRRARITRFWGETGKFELAGPIYDAATYQPEIVGSGVAYDLRGRNFSPGVHYAGGTVELAANPAVYYIANDARSFAVHSVKALKQYEAKVSNNTGNQTRRQLVDVPADYYSVNLNDTITFAGLGRAVTTICLSQALTQREDEGWISDELWVDISGYSRDGASLVQNPADALRYLLRDFGSVPAAQIDGTSFDAAAASTSARRFAFVLQKQWNLKSLVAELAFQAQCQIFVIAANFHCFFLDDQPGTSQATLESNPASGKVGVVVDSIERSWLSLHEVWTEVAAKYAPDYSGLLDTAENRFTLKDAAAETAYGRRAHELNLWAYRDINQAKAVAQYYLNHHSAVWEHVRLATYLDTLQVLPLDWVTIGGLPFWSAGQKARVLGTRHASGAIGAPDRIELDLWLPLYQGCSGACEVACEGAGCEGSSEHGCEDAAETSCITTCETSCQESCELICVTECQQGCTLACQQACQSACEGLGCEGNACETSTQCVTCETCETGNEGAGCDSVGLEVGCSWDCETAGSQAGCQMDGCQTGDESVGGGCGYCETGCESGIDQGPYFAFDVTVPADVGRNYEFDLTIQNIWISDTSPNTNYVPSGDVFLGATLSDSEDVFTPEFTDNTGWVSGAKTVSSAKISGGAGADTAEITAYDPVIDCAGSAETDINDLGFLVTAPANITRGAAFDLVIQAYDPDGDLDTSYVPAGDVDISDVCSDAGDDLLPAYTSNSGWSDGRKTVSCTIDGGADSDTCAITVTDQATGRTGGTDVAVAAAMTEFWTGSYIYEGVDYEDEVGVDDTDAAAASHFTAAQNNAQSNFNADTVFTASGGAENIPYRYIDDQSLYVNMKGQVRGGYLTFTLDAAARAGAKLVKLKCRAGAVRNIVGVGYEYSPQAGRIYLRMHGTESGSTYASGDALRQITPDLSIRYTLLNQMNDQNGGSASVEADIEIPIPLEVIENMVGDTLYLWLYADGPNVPYSSAYHGDVGTKFHEVWLGASDGSASPILEIFK